MTQGVSDNTWLFAILGTRFRLMTAALPLGTRHTPWSGHVDLHEFGWSSVSLLVIVDGVEHIAEEYCLDLLLGYAKHGQKRSIVHSPLSEDTLLRAPRPGGEYLLHHRERTRYRARGKAS